MRAVETKGNTLLPRIRGTIYNDSTCRVCRIEGNNEMIYHILAGCDRLAKREYFTRHNAVCKYLHYIICTAYGIPTGKNWVIIPTVIGGLGAVTINLKDPM